MDQVGKIEKVLASWYRKAPHLPLSGRKWLAENLWWMALVAMVLLVIGLFVIIPVLISALALTSSVGMVSPHVRYSTEMFALSWVSLAISVVSYMVSAVLMALAIVPLRERGKWGWELVFWSYLISFVLSVTSALVMMSGFSLVSAVVAAVVGGYFLFEVRDRFTDGKTHTKRVAKA